MNVLLDWLFIGLVFLTLAICFAFCGVLVSVGSDLFFPGDEQ